MNRIPVEVLHRLATPGVLADPLWITPDTAWSAHIPFAFWLIQAQAPATLVELGVHSGLSYCAFCQAIEANALTSAAYGVDTWEGDAHAGDYGERILEELRAHHDPLYASFSHLVRATFAAAAAHFAPGSVDLLHIDGLHTYEAVQQDFENWLPKLSSRGIILFHDVLVRERDFGVWKLWEQLRSCYPNHTFPFGHGLGVLAVGPEQPPALRWLFEGTERAAVNRFFALWGERLEARSGMARALRERLQAQRSVAPLQQEQEQLQRNLRKLNQELATTRATASTQKTTLEAALHELRMRLEQEQTELHNRSQELEACQQELGRRLQELDKARADHAALLNSTTWRGTAPLRKAVALTRSFAQRDDTSLLLPPTPALAQESAPAPGPISTSATTLNPASVPASVPASASTSVPASPSDPVTASTPPPSASGTTPPPGSSTPHLTAAGLGPSRAPSPGLDTPFDPARLGQPYPQREHWLNRSDPQVSLIVLNFDRPDLTLACLDALWQHTSGHSYEVVVVDNGSSPENFLRLSPHLYPCTTVRLNVNRYFGEGNNLGFEASRGCFVVFLNNDTRVTPGWLEPLIAPLAQDPTVGACGPRLLYPDGRLQEAGAEIRPDGTSLQYGKGGDANHPAHNQARAVPYISAATLALRRADFAALLGFDLRYEPAYYEDSDLCYRLREHGLSVRYCPASTVIHQESATTRTLVESMHLTNLVELNRERFLSRWRATLTAESAPAPPLAPEPRPPLEPPVPWPAFQPDLPAVVLFTPYDLIPGGGERYLLTVAAGLSHCANVTLCTQHPYSRLRLLTLGRELALDLSRIAPTSLSEALRHHNFAHAIVLGNHLIPPVPGLARNNVYICQFPFPMTTETAALRWSHGDDYHHVVVYSQYVRHHFERLCRLTGRSYPELRVIAPSAALVAPPGVPERQPWVLGVGRFFKDSHAKRQDLMIEAFAQLLELRPHAQLHLAGSLPAGPAYRDYYDELRAQAKGLPVFFHLNASPAELESLYRASSLYWHLSGYGVDDRVEPQRCEHFGITPVEAMSAGCIPLAANRGGPTETVRNGENGYLFETLEDLVRQSADLLGRAPADPLLERLRAAAVRTSAHYSGERLIREFRALLEL